MINHLTGKDEPSIKVVVEILEADCQNVMRYKDNVNDRSWFERAIITGTLFESGKE